MTDEQKTLLKAMIKKCLKYICVTMLLLVGGFMVTASWISFLPRAIVWQKTDLLLISLGILIMGMFIAAVGVALLFWRKEDA